MKTERSVVDFNSSVNESSDKVNFLAQRSKTKKIVKRVFFLLDLVLH